jgi:hypothetical protein
MPLYGGIDLHANNSVIVLLNEQDEVIYRKRLSNDLPVILEQSATSGKGGLKKVEPLKAVEAVNRSKRFGCEPPTGGPSYHRAI